MAYSIGQELSFFVKQFLRPTNKCLGRLLPWQLNIWGHLAVIAGLPKIWRFSWRSKGFVPPRIPQASPNQVLQRTAATLARVFDMTSQQASQLIEVLQYVAKAPGMFLGKPDIKLAIVFLFGFRIALEKACGLDLSLALQVITSRGWQLPRGASGPASVVHKQMLERGMSSEQVIAELVAIEIDVIKLSTV